MRKCTLMQVAFEDLPEGQTVATLIAGDDSGLMDVDDADLQQAHDDSNEIDELISTTCALESIYHGAKDSCRTGGLSYPAASALDVAMEHFCARAKITASRRVGMESFKGGSSQRIQTTQVAMEDMGETLRRLIKKILAWIKHVATLCYEIVERIVRGANAVGEHAQNVQTAATALLHKSVDNSKIATISVSKLTSFFNEKGVPMDPKEIIRQFQEYCTMVNDSFNSGKLFQPAVRGLTELEHYVKSHGEEHVDMQAVEGFAATACDQLVKNSLSHFTPSTNEGVDLLSHKLPFGNSDLVFSFVKGQASPGENVGFHVAIAPDPVEKAPDLPALRPQEVVNLTSVLISEMGKGIYRDSRVIRAAIHDVIMRVEKQSYQLSDRQRLMGASSVPTLNLIKLISDSSLKVTRLLYSYSGISTRRLLSYAELSLKAYDKASIS